MENWESNWNGIQTALHKAVAEGDEENFLRLMNERMEVLQQVNWTEERRALLQRWIEEDQQFASEIQKKQKDLQKYLVVHTRKKHVVDKYRQF